MFPLQDTTSHHVPIGGSNQPAATCKGWLGLHPEEPVDQYRLLMEKGGYRVSGYTPLTMNGDTFHPGYTKLQMHQENAYPVLAEDLR